MSNTPTSGTSHPASCIQRLTSRISHLATYTIIQLLTVAIKFRKAGLISLFVFFLINCYFMLFDQQNYISFLQHNISLDGHISDINTTFIKILSFIFWLTFIYIYLIWLCLPSPPQQETHWRHKKIFYIIASFIWLFILYLPTVVFDFDTIKSLATEDSFYENSEFCWFFLASISFFYLYFKKQTKCQIIALNKSRNIFFLLLGLLFFFAAGEEISWGQRIFGFQTPRIAASNIQHEFNIHNLPLFDVRKSVHTTKDGQLIGVFKHGLPQALTIVSLFSYFWISFCILIPSSYVASRKVRKLLDNIYFPVVPIWIGLLFILNYIIYHQLLPSIIPYRMAYPMDELRETGYSFLFFILSLWFVNTSNNCVRKVVNSN